MQSAQRRGRSGAGPARPAQPRRQPGGQQAQLQAAVDQAQSAVTAAKARLDAIKNGGIDAQRAQLQAQREQAQSQLTGWSAEPGSSRRHVCRPSRTAPRTRRSKTPSSQVTAVPRAAQERPGQTRPAARRANRRRPPAGAIGCRPGHAAAGARRPAQHRRRTSAPSARRLSKLGCSCRKPGRRIPTTTSSSSSRPSPKLRPSCAQAEPVHRPGSGLGAGVGRPGQGPARPGRARRSRTRPSVAPVDGVISERLVSPGALVNPQSPIVTLVPPVARAGGQRRREPARPDRRRPVGPARRCRRSRARRSPARSSRSRRPSTARAARRPCASSRTTTRSKLRAGMFARLNIVTAEKQNALIVPREAILTGTPGTQPLVIAIDPAGRVHRQPVQARSSERSLRRDPERHRRRPAGRHQQPERPDRRRHRRPAGRDAHGARALSASGVARRQRSLMWLTNIAIRRPLFILMVDRRAARRRPGLVDQAGRRPAAGPRLPDRGGQHGRIRAPAPRPSTRWSPRRSRTPSSASTTSTTSQSNSTEGVSTVVIFFKDNAPKDSSIDVERKVSAIRGNLPTDAKDPIDRQVRPERSADSAVDRQRQPRSRRPAAAGRRQDPEARRRHRWRGPGQRARRPRARDSGPGRPAESCRRAA